MRASQWESKSHDTSSAARRPAAYGVAGCCVRHLSALHPPTPQAAQALGCCARFEFASVHSTWSRAAPMSKPLCKQLVTNLICRDGGGNAALFRAYVSKCLEARPIKYAILNGQSWSSKRRCLLRWGGLWWSSAAAQVHDIPQALPQADHGASGRTCTISLSQHIQSQTMQSGTPRKRNMVAGASCAAT